MNNNIRLATAADARTLATIHVEGWLAAYRDIVPPELLASRSIDARERDFIELLSGNHEGHHVWVSERDGESVGFAYTRPGLEADIERSGELKLFYVNPLLRGSGVGLPLFEHAIGALRARGLQPYLYTLRDNAAARTWYEKRGWRHDGATTPWSDRGEYPELVEVRYRPGP